MLISVTEPLSAAFARMKYILFSPFDFPKWLTLGFCAFLVALGQGGTPNFGFRGGTRHVGSFGHGANWVMENLAILIPLAAIILVLIIALGLLVSWLSARGEFMFLDGVVRNKGAVAEPWRRFRALGNSLFLFRFLLGLAVLLVMAVLAGVFALLAWSDLRGHNFGAGTLLAVIGSLVTILPLSIAVAVFMVLVHDFVVPIMYRRNVLVLEALGIFRTEILANHVGPIALFCLMRFVLGIAAAVIMMLGACVTCCIAGLPYVSSVVFLPISVLFRAYSLCFLEQFGEQWGLFPQPSLAPPERDSQRPIV